MELSTRMMVQVMYRLCSHPQDLQRDKIGRIRGTLPSHTTTDLKHYKRMLCQALTLPYFLSRCHWISLNLTYPKDTIRYQTRGRPHSQEEMKTRNQRMIRPSRNNSNHQCSRLSQQVLIRALKPYRTLLSTIPPEHLKGQRNPSRFPGKTSLKFKTWVLVTLDESCLLLLPNWAWRNFD